MIVERFYRLGQFTRFPTWKPRCERRTFIYALLDPRDKTVRYVGVSVNPEKRLRYHVSQPGNFHLSAWVKELKAIGEKPYVITLAEVCMLTWEAAEKSWIGFFRNSGDLYNIHDGGAGKGAKGVPKFTGKPKVKLRKAKKHKGPRPPRQKKLTRAQKRQLRVERHRSQAQVGGSCLGQQPHDWMWCGPDQVCIRCAKSRERKPSKSERRLLLYPDLRQSS